MQDLNSTASCMVMRMENLDSSASVQYLQSSAMDDYKKARFVAVR